MSTSPVMHFTFDKNNMILLDGEDRCLAFIPYNTQLWNKAVMLVISIQEDHNEVFFFDENTMEDIWDEMDQVDNRSKSDNYYHRELVNLSVTFYPRPDGNIKATWIIPFQVDENMGCIEEFDFLLTPDLWAKLKQIFHHD